METRTIYQTADYEQQLIGVVRRLPRERVVEVIDFAQFLEFKTSEDYDDDLLGDAANQARIAEENARWDALLETAESQRLLEKMAAEALAEMQVGLARPMIFTEDGEIAPGEWEGFDVGDDGDFGKEVGQTVEDQELMQFLSQRRQGARTSPWPRSRHGAG
ncbi:MAG: hypothetical protein NT169_09290 [Chloroflexi bacterium]|nr:hypothetical protein [Chloroflexota bacterium]